MKIAFISDRKQKKRNEKMETVKEIVYEKNDPRLSSLLHSEVFAMANLCNDTELRILKYMHSDAYLDPTLHVPLSKEEEEEEENASSTDSDIENNASDHSDIILPSYETNRKS